MKKTFNILVALIFVLSTASCSRHNYNVLELVPADVEFSAVLSPAHTSDISGITVAKDNTLEFPASFTESTDAATLNDIEAVNKFLKVCGLDLDSLTLYLTTYHDKPVSVLKLKDTKRFVNKLTEDGYKFIRGQLGVKINC